MAGHASTEDERATVETTYEEVARHFAQRAPDARRRLMDWRADPHKKDVVPFVESAVTRVWYAITPEDVERVCRATEHALSNVRRPRHREWRPLSLIRTTSTATLHLPTRQEILNRAELLTSS